MFTTPSVCLRTVGLGSELCPVGLVGIHVQNKAAVGQPVNQYVAQGRIPGAERFGRSWAIPDDAVKPTDPRKQTPPIPGTNSKTK